MTLGSRRPPGPGALQADPPSPSTFPSREIDGRSSTGPGDSAKSQVEGAMASQRVIVVGAGALGGWIALKLRERGVDVQLIDAWGPGHARASSGGETRVLRAIYGDRRLSELAR